MLKNAVTVYQVSARQGQMAGARDIWRELCPKETEELPSTYIDLPGDCLGDFMTQPH